MILIDWLHTADIGIAGDVVGNIFNEVAKLLPGNTKEERVKVLWGKVRLYYKASHTPNRLQTLTPTMIKADGKPPKLKAKAAITRHLVPVAAFIANEVSLGTPHWITVVNCADLLAEVYTCKDRMPLPC